MTAVLVATRAASYRVTFGLETVEVPATLARFYWDATPGHLRTGERERAFILWGTDRNGWRAAPVIFKPIAL